ncbi:hypothetical protein [Rhizohabitans arisaemae]|uniref:hypothetical protein n=1 Tax=Rhizohabitans arisaemae TaxID=2720610 RepID=UPI0024B1E789|nr:hypothetical protein [Rhizohabitans arisaemae]
MASARCGGLPWSPSDQARDLDVWHQYEVPLVGTFMWGKQTVLFTVVGDANGHVSIWAYIDLAEEQATELRDLEFESEDELRRFVATAFSGRKALLALARDLCVGEWSPVTVEQDLTHSAITFVQDVVKSRDDHIDPATRLRADLAAADVVISHEFAQA